MPSIQSEIYFNGDARVESENFIMDCIFDENEHFEYGYPHASAILCLFIIKALECCKPFKAAYHLAKCDIINDDNLFPTLYHRIYCCKYWNLSDKNSPYESK